MSHWKIRPDTLKTISMLIGLLAALLTFSSHTVLASQNMWAKHSQASRKSDVLKPVDPIFFNDGGTIALKLGEEWSFFYPLETGKRYHVFLVGEWVKNTTDPLTDYDIRTYDPNGKWLSDHTESAGLPEQVANDDRHQYFVPEMTGDYEFNVINDPRDSKNDEPATLMVIEHIDMNVRYTRYLVGRDERTDEPLLLTSWAHVLNTSSARIRVFVDVPDSLDMYEVRLYAMANPDAEVGYLIDGLGVPSGDLFDNFVGEYGGFNTSEKGERNIDAMDSCEYSGQDMEFTYDTPNAENETSNVFYYLALIAEHGEGTVEFYAQTDFAPSNIKLFDPPEKGYAGEETTIKAYVDDDSEIQRVWVEFTDDGGKTLETEELTLEGDLYVCDLPPFSAGVYVNYTVYAEDVVGNVGSIDAGFQVKNRVTLDCSIADSKLKVGENVVVSGTISPRSSTILLQFRNKEYKDNFEVVTDASGAFSCSYKPNRLGEWSMEGLFSGDELNFPASSDLLKFTIESEPTSLICTLSPTEAKKNRPLTVSGTVIPPIRGLAIVVTLASSTSSHTETVVTDAEGGFSYSFKPTETGVWNIIAQVSGDNIQYAPSQSDLMEAIIMPIGPLDMVTDALRMTITPPYQYPTIGLIGVGVALAIYKGRDRLASLRPSSGSGKTKRGGKKRTGNKNRRYRRNRR